MLLLKGSFREFVFFCLDLSIDKKLVYKENCLLPRVQRYNSCSLLTIPDSLLFLAEVGNFKCENPLGVQDEERTITDDKMSASSFVNSVHEARFGRLLYERSAWCARSDDVNGYLEIDLKRVTYLNALAMQGDPLGPNYVNEFAVHVKETKTSAMVEKMVSVKAGIHHQSFCDHSRKFARG